MENNFGNYVGPYWSDGKIQESVEWGESEPVNELDELARQHDSAYAKYKDRAHREAADQIFAERARALEGKFPGLAANVVQYGNYAGRQAGELADAFATAGPFGLLYFGAKGIVQSQQRLDGNYLKKEREDVLAYYQTDPRLKPIESVDLTQDPFAKSVSPTLWRGGYELEPVVTPPPMPRSIEGPTVDDLKPKMQGTLAKQIAGPTQEDLRKEILVAKQRRNLENYKALHQAAQRNSVHPMNNSSWNALGYQGRRNKIQKQAITAKNKKKNKIQPVCV